MPPDAAPPDERRSFRPAAPRRSGLVVSRGAVAAAAGLGTMLLAWAGGATWFAVFRDDFAQNFLSRQDEMRFGYEDRIGELTRALERELTHGLVQKDSVEERLRFLAGRQAIIEARQAWLSRAVDRKGDGPADRRGDGPDSTGSLGTRRTPASAGRRSDEPVIPDAPTSPLASDKPQPLGNGPGLGLRNGLSPDGSAEAPEPPRPLDRLGVLEQRLDGMAARELRVVRRLADGQRGSLGRVRAALDATGLSLDRRLGRADTATGGPFVPAPSLGKGDVFGVVAAEYDALRDETARLRAVARTLPLGRPLAGELDLTSPFGYRADPFTRTPALHTGADYRAEYGAPVRATAGGRVVSAEYSGGYGNLVEVDHGDGLATRYGHLSAFAVSVGDRVAAGDVVGRAGSTGRSTGTHVHYETRINGEPVNPVRFIQAGKLLDSAAGAGASSGNPG